MCTHPVPKLMPSEHHPIELLSFDIFSLALGMILLLYPLPGSDSFRLPSHDIMLDGSFAVVNLWALQCSSFPILSAHSWFDKWAWFLWLGIRKILQCSSMAGAKNLLVQALNAGHCVMPYGSVTYHLYNKSTTCFTLVRWMFSSSALHQSSRGTPPLLL
ncbi:hypothetical protein BVRB_4g083790 [Beta vulgaris subsp. vulgaris]|nr:hypothetical protein BVRB_4g083790 [Beta vulgaris subsp. vulgaris]